jgi:hypothetical protein
MQLIKLNNKQTEQKDYKSVKPFGSGELEDKNMIIYFKK